MDPNSSENMPPNSQPTPQPSKKEAKDEESLLKIKESEEDKTNEKIEERKKNFLMKLNKDDYKRKRDDVFEKLRKKKREEIFNKRRNMTFDQSPDVIQQYGNIYSNLTFKIEDLPAIVENMNSTEESKLYYSVVGCRKLLANEGISPIQEIIDANLVPKLIELIAQHDKPHLQFEAAWCLTNIATGTAEQTQCLTEKGAIPKFIDLLRSERSNIKDQAIWALGNIAGENTTYRNLVIDCGIIPPLLHILSTETQFNIIKNGVWCLSNICRNRPPPKFKLVRDSIPVICELTKNHEDKDILTDCCWTLSYLSDGGEKRIPYLLKCNIIGRLIFLLDHPCMSIAVPALRTLGNVITGDDEQTQAVIEEGILPPLTRLMEHPKSAVRKEASWAASNITAGNSTQIKSVIESGCMAKLISIASGDLFEIKREAVWAISNATSGADPNEVQKMVELGAIEALSNILIIPEPRTLAISLEGIENLLKKGRDFFNTEGVNLIALRLDTCGGMTKIENLQQHPNIHIYNRAVKILEEYFGAEEEEMNDVAQPEQLNIFQF